MTGNNHGEGNFVFSKSERYLDFKDISKGAYIKVGNEKHVPFALSLDKINIVDSTAIEIEKLVIKQNGNDVEKIEIGSSFTVEATLKDFIIDLNKLNVSIDIAAFNDAQKGANTPITKSLTLQENSDVTYSGTFKTAHYSDEDGFDTFKGLENDWIIASYDQVEAKAYLSDESNKRTITVNTTDGLGERVSARAYLLEKPEFIAYGNVKDAVYEFVSNRPVKIDDKIKGDYSLFVEYLNCCRYATNITIPEDGDSEFNIPKLAHVKAEALMLNEDQRIQSTIVAYRNNFLSVKNIVVKENGDLGWAPLASTGNYMKASVLEGLNIAPGTYDFRLIHSEASSKMEEPISVNSGSNLIVFNEDNSAKLSEDQAQETLQNAKQEYQELKDYEDFDGDGIPNIIDNKPRQYSNIVFNENMSITGRIIDRAGYKIKFSGNGEGGISLEVEPDYSDNPRKVIIELLGVELILDPGTILEAAFG